MRTSSLNIVIPTLYLITKKILTSFEDQNGLRGLHQGCFCQLCGDELIHEEKPVGLALETT